MEFGLPAARSAFSGSSSLSPQGHAGVFDGLNNFFTGNLDFQRSEYQRLANNQFNAEQAQISRDWQERMSSTAYQRAVADMRKAGLNPALMFGSGSAASTPSGSSASGSQGGSFRSGQGWQTMFSAMATLLSLGTNVYLTGQKLSADLARTAMQVNSRRY